MLLKESSISRKAKAPDVYSLCCSEHSLFLIIAVCNAVPTVLTYIRMLWITKSVRIFGTFLFNWSTSLSKDFKYLGLIWFDLAALKMICRIGLGIGCHWKKNCNWDNCFLLQVLKIFFYHLDLMMFFEKNLFIAYMILSSVIKSLFKFVF